MNTSETTQETKVIAILPKSTSHSHKPAPTSPCSLLVHEIKIHQENHKLNLIILICSTHFSHQDRPETFQANTSSSTSHYQIHIRNPQEPISCTNPATGSTFTSHLLGAFEVPQRGAEGPSTHCMGSLFLELYREALMEQIQKGGFQLRKVEEVQRPKVEDFLASALSSALDRTVPLIAANNLTIEENEWED
eukprot:TRINITY_DN19913_c0_g1_i1.p1 TRINITY_DN19913_c0_g1~~TRINITY_DN19913_c0_g1_i1.p1  ORF type:complete len:192 (+),score=62.93 TRINITY_DN19913_c0_g1_i1:140-715(+)